jgi:hypothetical protein
MINSWHAVYRRRVRRRRLARALRRTLFVVSLGGLLVVLGYLVGKGPDVRYYGPTGGVAGASTGVSLEKSGSKPARLTAHGGVDLLSRASLLPVVGRYAVARNMPVRQVVGDEEFWIGRSSARRVLVHLESRGESGERIRRGDRVSFLGVVARNAPGAAATWGIAESEGAALLERQGAHVVARAARVRVLP